ncbi:MAG TPA: DinB family protein [Anditalea sp.]|nr:DinB family protein [Anditalea sp.]
MNDLMKPKGGEYNPYYERYVSYTNDQDLKELLFSQINELEFFLSTKSNNWFNKPYQVDKWTPKELIGHIIDTERIFAYRSLCLARGEQGQLPGFDENAYVAAADFNDIHENILMEDFRTSRMALLSMIRNFHDQAFTRVGMVNGSSMTCRACIAIIAGHFIHHMNIMKERY